MTLEQSILLLILGSTTILYARRWIPPEATSILAVCGLALTGLLSASEALAGFSSSATLTVSAMFVLSAGLVRTGSLEAVTLQLARFSRGSRRRLLVLLGITVPAASAFMNNTPVVVMLIPVIKSLGRQFKIRPSLLLIPLSYFAILGGTITLIGTSTNILIDELYRQSGGPGLGIFEFMPLGLAFTAIGVIYTVLFSRLLLPKRTPLADLVSERPKSAYLTEVVIEGRSKLVGERAIQAFAQIAAPEPISRQTHTSRHRRLGAGRIRQTVTEKSDGIELIQVVRAGIIYRAEELESLLLRADDLLMISGDPKEISLFLDSNGVRLTTVLEDNRRVSIDNTELTFTEPVIEAVLLPDSPCNGRFIGELGLARDHGVRVMGIQRHGRQQLTGLRTMRLASGDVLLLRGPQEELHAAAKEGHLLIVEGVGQSILRSARNRQAILIMVAVVALATLTPIPIVILALAGAALMVITQCLSLEDALQSLDANALLVLVAAIPLGKAMETTGLAQSAVDLLTNSIGSANPILFLSLFYLLANITAQIISTKAVAVLFVPVALNLAVSLGLNPTPLIMAIAFGANASLTTPIGHPVNTIVMGPGGYRFGDYLKIGLPLMILLWLTATLLIPIIWPLV